MWLENRLLSPLNEPRALSSCGESLILGRIHHRRSRTGWGSGRVRNPQVKLCNHILTSPKFAAFYGNDFVRDVRPSIRYVTHLSQFILSRTGFYSFY